VVKSVVLTGATWTFSLMPGAFLKVDWSEDLIDWPQA
jgi:hypothetical protein